MSTSILHLDLIPPASGVCLAKRCGPPLVPTSPRRQTFTAARTQDPVDHAIGAAPDLLHKLPLATTNRRAILVLNTVHRVNDIKNWVAD